MHTLRSLLIQRAARLQQRPAFSAQGWQLDYGQLRNRVEGLAMGLLATTRPVGETVFLAESGPWGWMAELAAACCGLRWEATGQPLPATLLGGPLFNAEEGRGPYHDRDHEVQGETSFTSALTHHELLRRLTRLNVQLGWDHDTTLTLPLETMGTPGGRGALWSALYAGAFVSISAATPHPSPSLWRSAPKSPAFDPTPFVELGL